MIFNPRQSYQLQLDTLPLGTQYVILISRMVRRAQHSCPKVQTSVKYGERRSCENTSQTWAIVHERINAQGFPETSHDDCPIRKLMTCSFSRFSSTQLRVPITLYYKILTFMLFQFFCGLPTFTAANCKRNHIQPIFT